MAEILVVFTQFERHMLVIYRTSVRRILWLKGLEER